MFFVQDTPITGVLAGMADLSVLSLPQWIPVDQFQSLFQDENP